MLSRFSIKALLATLVLVPLAVLVLVIVLSLQTMVRLVQGVDSLYADRVVPLKQIKVTSDSYGIAVVDAFQKYRAGMIGRSELIDEVTEAVETGSREWALYLQTRLTPREKTLIEAAETHLGPVEQFIDRYLAMAEAETLASVDQDRFTTELYTTFDPLTASLNDLVDLQKDEASVFVERTDADFEVLFWELVIAAVVLVIAVALAGYFIYRSINRPIGALRTIMSDIADNKDLTRRVEVIGRDEVAQLGTDFNRMLERFQTLIAQLRDAAEQSSTAAEEMSAVSTQVSTTVQEQEEQVNMVATAITEMSGAVQEVANNASETSNRASEADTQSQQGRAKVKDNLDSIHTLSESIREASRVITALHEQSGDITEVLTVIRNIAEQTNLLALNAAIESARAGEAGRGFAVVADEVRKLAQNTQEATESISEMIDKLQLSAQDAVSTMGRASEQAGRSVEFAQASGDILEAIAESVSRIAEMNIQVSTATEEQASVANEITENINRFSGGLSEVAQSAEQSARASGEIARLSNDLQQQVTVFRA
ncbi:methyl-accepting chemotaxis protein [Saccharospirillum salsuginis]|uniref:Chemotaxis transducer n=1 Tax=Saccharospirillum salsuginis TaxID=418750 RepID=A0A918K491_9GAMM|nr:methyl-accepting chemotaxis protein [Saccharospirillum salsuginis]GGX45104.1 chemotaxis transducer [Saccharospirillum salsuginis]